ncbi:MAG: Mur ligase domain-containing protein [Turneriella sp.]|nr:Mur ligase domain-containing protein [Turneriella sp.]
MALAFTGRKIHIVGAGGVGMSALALLSQRLGAVLTASDQNNSPYLQKLEQQGIPTWVGSQPERIPPDAEVFYSSAVPAQDPERRFAEDRGQNVLPRHALLAEITHHYFTIAVAGCHGKTTTTAWVAELLLRAGLDPTALVGGTVRQWQSNFRAGNGQLAGRPLLVLEADESDKSFLAIAASVALITNVDLDHTDVHKDIESLRADYLTFVNQTQKRGGWVQVSKECDAELVAKLSAEENALWQAIGIAPEKQALRHGHELYPVGLPGRHNLFNASLVLQLGLKLKIPNEVLKAVLREFSGVARRLEPIATFPQWQLTVIDDYAHHPHELAASLATLEEQYAHLLIFWEPHRLSRFHHFYREFDAVLRPYAEKHAVFVLPIFAAGDRAEDYPHTQERWSNFLCPPYLHVSSTEDFPRTRERWQNKKMAAVFCGAGKSSEFAQQYARWLSTFSAESVYAIGNA